MILLDTHILIFALEGRLRPAEDALLRDEGWSIADISLWEIQLLEHRGKIAPLLSTPEMATVCEQIRIWPIDLEVARMVPMLDFRSDPADELMAATSIVHAVPLLTRDSVILQSGMVPLAIDD